MQLLIKNFRRAIFIFPYIQLIISLVSHKFEQFFWNKINVNFTFSFLKKTYSYFNESFLFPVDSNKHQNTKVEFLIGDESIID